MRRQINRGCAYTGRVGAKMTLPPRYLLTRLTRGAELLTLSGGPLHKVAMRLTGGNSLHFTVTAGTQVFSGFYKCGAWVSAI